MLQHRFDLVTCCFEGSGFDLLLYRSNLNPLNTLGSFTLTLNTLGSFTLTLGTFGSFTLTLGTFYQRTMLLCRISIGRIQL